MCIRDSAIAALNDLDMNQIIIEKDKAASVKYNHRTSLEQFIVDMRNKELDLSLIHI